MLTINLILISSFIFVHSNRIGHDGKTALAIKQDIEDFSDPIPVGISDFKELIRKSKLFIDNSLFIKEILDKVGQKRLKLLTPSQWGKTTLLTMLKAFLEIEVDEQGELIFPLESRSNYRLFREGEITHPDGTVEKLQTPLLIANEEETLVYYLGARPVIYMSFKNVIGTNFDEIERNITLAVNSAYKQHAYLMKRFEKMMNRKDISYMGMPLDAQMDLEKFQRFLNATEDFTFKLCNFTESIYFLNEMLTQEFKINSVLMIDDFDTPFHSALKFPRFGNADDLNLFRQFDYIMSVLTHRNIFNEWVMIILTGTFCIRLEDFFKFWREHITEECITHNQITWSPFREYFAFKENHVQFLLDKQNIGDLAPQAQKWYNGYRSSASKQNYYNPVSIVKLLHHKKIDYFKAENNYDNFIQMILNNELLPKKTLLKLLSKQEEESLYIQKQKHAHNGPQTFPHNREIFPKYTVYDAFSAILWGEQYIIGNSTTKTCKIANNQAAHLMSDWLICYYKRKCNIDADLIDQVSETFLDFTTNRVGIETLKESLQALYKNMISNVVANYFENEAHSILNCITLRMQCLSKFQIDVYYDKIKTADLVFHCPKMQKVIAIELYQNQVPANALSNSANKYAQVLKSFSNVRTAELIEINILKDNAVDISVKSLI